MTKTLDVICNHLPSQR